MKIKLSVAEHKLKELTEKIKKSAIQMETDRRMIEYQEITELTPQLMKELVKRIMIRPDGSIRIEWNFRDEMNEPIPFDFDGKATSEEKAM